MKQLKGLFALLSLCLLFFSQVYAETYTTPQAFMDLYFDFTGNSEVDFPKGKLTIPQYLLQSEKTEANLFTGPLVLFIDSSIYIYDQNRKLLYSKVLRTNRSTGFFELTAVSHVGPALSYLAKIKENGDPSWKPAMANLLADIKKVRALNAQNKDNWLKRGNFKPWQTHLKEIQVMIDYAMSMAGNYIISVQNGAEFNLNSVQQEFLNGNKKYPIPYNSVMVATFMLTALESMSEVYDDLVPLKLDWSKAMVIMRNVAGSNVSAGLTVGTNWMVPFVNALSNNQIPVNRIIIAPYAKVLADLGQTPLAVASYQYYASAVWRSIYNRTRIAKEVFTGLTTIYLPGRPAIPGDYGYSTASDINDFMVRLKHSLADSREMLSNTVGFWMAGELQNKGWDAARIDIPGLTTGLPKGIKTYPQQNPEIDQ
ncbi:hypothetical protein BN59_02601 [Legionella massiliensis]|uniref:DUF5624 domain-containing protein n=1 Tax=Legionella massiliensis TaxID=1034943 RepID=A0A078KZE5_9GAMM|nr:DUF5624 domain-containing protein [Legionella massiliensis]CDZ78291.1 hypothetical protein BN59_02601 [Legionella massiliensis]CEE14029.1 hypothetical protein BN1094_02601 [Legionella massiliensis]